MINRSGIYGGIKIPALWKTSRSLAGREISFFSGQIYTRQAVAPNFFSGEQLNRINNASPVMYRKLQTNAGDAVLARIGRLLAANNDLAHSSTVTALHFPKSRSDVREFMRLIVRTVTPVGDAASACNVKIDSKVVVTKVAHSPEFDILYMPGLLNASPAEST